jgi:biotin carboxyl carrier protein
MGGGEGIEVVAPMTASVWKIQVKEGDVVKDGQVLAILEAMKMEIREFR